MVVKTWIPASRRNTRIRKWTNPQPTLQWNRQRLRMKLIFTTIKSGWNSKCSNYFTSIKTNLRLIKSYSLIWLGTESMAGSSVFPHYVFLKNLGKDNLRDRIQRVRLINVDTMKALSKIVHFILMNYVPPLSYDQRAFQTYRLVIRHFSSPTVSLSRKKATLERYHSLIPKLLREHYIINTCLYELRQSLGMEYIGFQLIL